MKSRNGRALLVLGLGGITLSACDWPIEAGGTSSTSIDAGSAGAAGSTGLGGATSTTTTDSGSAGSAGSTGLGGATSTTTTDSGSAGAGGSTGLGGATSTTTTDSTTSTVVECSTIAECPVPPECHAAICNAAAQCLQVPAPAGAPCLLGACNGMGTCVPPPPPCGTLSFGAPSSLYIDTKVALSDVWAGVFLSPADLDADGDLDFAVGLSSFGPDPATEKYFLAMNGGTGVLTKGTEYDGVGPSPLNLAAVDVNGNGIPDILKPDNVYLRVVKDQSPQDSDEYTFPSFVTSIATADFDGDGDVDIVTVHLWENAVRVMSNLGDGTFSTVGPFPVGQFPRWAAPADLDADGDIDLAVANYKGKSVSVLFNQGNGSWTPGIPTNLGAQLLRVAASDLNGDGHADLIVSAANGIHVLMNQLNGMFSSTLSIPLPLGDATFDALLLADMDGDGADDLIHAGGPVTIRRNVGGGAFGPAEWLWLDNTGVFAIAAVDLNGDGRRDLAVSSAMGAFPDDGAMSHLHTALNECTPIQ